MPFKDLFACHDRDLASVGIDETRRAFISTGHYAVDFRDKRGRFVIAPHNHSYDLKITVLRGYLKHYVVNDYHIPNTLHLQLWPMSFKSGLKEGEDPSAYTMGFPKWFSITEETMNPGDCVLLTSNTVHTVGWSQDAIWLVEEMVPTFTTSKVCYSVDGKLRLGVNALYQPMHKITADNYREEVRSLMEKHDAL